MSREAGVVVANLQNLCIILADSAEVAAEVRSSSSCGCVSWDAWYPVSAESSYTTDHAG